MWVWIEWVTLAQFKIFLASLWGEGQVADSTDAYHRLLNAILNFKWCCFGCIKHSRAVAHSVQPPVLICVCFARCCNLTQSPRWQIHYEGFRPLSTSAKPSRDWQQPKQSPSTHSLQASIRSITESRRPRQPILSKNTSFRIPMYAPPRTYDQLLTRFMFFLSSYSVFTILKKRGNSWKSAENLRENALMWKKISSRDHSLDLFCWYFYCTSSGWNSLLDMFSLGKMIWIVIKEISLMK